MPTLNVIKYIFLTLLKAVMPFTLAWLGPWLEKTIQESKESAGMNVTFSLSFPTLP